MGQEDVLHGIDFPLGPPRRELAEAEYDVVAGWRQITRGRVADEDLPFPTAFRGLMQPEGYIAALFSPQSKRGRLLSCAVSFTGKCIPLQ